MKEKAGSRESTGAERSSDLSAVFVTNWQQAWEIAKRERWPEQRPTDDRSAPAAPREPNLPSSLTFPHRHMKGGIKGC